MLWLSSTSTALVTAVPREKGNLGRMIQRWQVVRFQVRECLIDGINIGNGLWLVMGITESYQWGLVVDFLCLKNILYTHKCGW